MFMRKKLAKCYGIKGKTILPENSKAFVTNDNSSFAWETEHILTEHLSVFLATCLTMLGSVHL
jgi:hypothetical protein